MDRSPTLQVAGQVPVTPARRRKGRLFRRAAMWLSAAALLYFATAYASTRLHWVSMAEAGAPPALPASAVQRVAGAIHVHTGRSHDALGTDAEVAEAARAAGLDFVFLTDHRGADAPPPEWERPAHRDDSVLLVRGQEIRVDGLGYALVDRLDTAVVSWTGGGESFLQRVERDSAFAVVAHPRSLRPEEVWRGGRAPAMAAWEAFDLVDVARRRLGDWAVVYHLVALVGGELAGRSEHSWLRLYRNGFRDPGVRAFDSLWVGDGPTAVGGIDMHPKVRLPGRRLFPAYTPSFRTIVNHVAIAPSSMEAWSADAGQAARVLGAAIRQGDVYISFGATEAARAFRIGMVTGTSAGEHTPLGGAVSVGERPYLVAGFAGDPGHVAYRVLRDGRELGWRRGPALDWQVDAPGAYRVEVYRYSIRLGALVWNLRPWIFANPVLVRSETGG